MVFPALMTAALLSPFRIPSLPGVAAALCALFASLASAGPARAEEPYVVWAKTPSWGYFTANMASTPRGVVLGITSGGVGGLLELDTQGRVVSSNLVSSLPGQMSGTTGIAIESTGATFLLGRGGPDGGKAFSVVKLKASGELAWVRRESTPLSGSPNYPGALALEAQGSLWVSGVSQGPFTLGSVALGVGRGPFLCKLDRDGQVLWGMRIDYQPSGAPPMLMFPTLSRTRWVMCYSPAGWPGAADFGGTTVYPGATQPDPVGNGFIAKYSASGSLLWVRMSELPEYVMYSIAVDRHGNTYFVGPNGWFGKLTGNGELVWAKQFPGALPSNRQGIAIDSNDEPVFTGEISGTVRFDDVILISEATNGQDFFIAKADASGNIQWALRGGGVQSARGRCVLCDQSGNVFLGADITGKTTARFDGTTLTPRSEAGGYPTLVLAKISPTPPMAIEFSAGVANLSWPAKATNYALEVAAALPAITWDPVTNSPTVGTNKRNVPLPLTGAMPASSVSASREHFATAWHG